MLHKILLMHEYFATLYNFVTLSIQKGYTVKLECQSMKFNVYFGKSGKYLLYYYIVLSHTFEM